MSIWDKEPVAVIAAAAVAVVNTGLQALAAFAIFVTPGQGAAVGGFVTATIALAALFARGQVVPINAPDGPDRLMKARLKRAGVISIPNAGAARSPYRVPAQQAAELGAPRRRSSGELGLLLAVLAVACFAGASFSCTPAEVQIAHGVITVGGVVCDDVLTASDPTLAPLCVTAEEVALAIAELVEEQKAASAGKVGAAIGPLLLPSKDAQYKRVLANRAAKKGTAK
jgi:hypothetical protein